MSLAGDLKAKYEAQRVARLKKYGTQITKMYYGAIDEAARAAAGTALKDGVFKLDKYPALNQKVDKILEKLSGKIDVFLYNKIAAEWVQSELNNDGLFDRLLNRKGKTSDLLNSRNADALQAFQNRVDSDGLNLSDRIYKRTAQYRGELEVGLGQGIAYGKPAAQMARDLKTYLNEPDKLFRRVKNDDKLKLSKPALEYKPGQGVYRSSHKNILRLTRTETNMAYRRADVQRYERSPFITGFEVKLSNRHPMYDICDQLAGLYPKTFVFIGWHPQCLCYSVPVLLTPDQFDKMETDLLAGKDISKISYSDQPSPTGAQAKEWFTANKERVDKWKTTPYFIKDNAQFFKQ